MPTLCGAGKTIPQMGSRMGNKVERPLPPIEIMASADQRGRFSAERRQMEADPRNRRVFGDAVIQADVRGLIYDLSKQWPYAAAL